MEPLAVAWFTAAKLVRASSLIVYNKINIFYAAKPRQAVRNWSKLASQFFRFTMRIAIPFSKLSRFFYFLLLSNFLSCATQPTIDTTKKKNKSEIETRIENTIPLGRPVQENQIRRKMQAFEKALAKGSFSEAEWKLHDELLNEYIRLKQLGSTKIVVPPRTKIILPIESYCLESNKSGPSEKEIFHWQKGRPPVPYYKEILTLRREGVVAQKDAQELIWNLRNKTKWEEYPDKLKAILQTIDPNAALKLPSKLKSQAADSLIGMASSLSGVDTARELYHLAEGRFHRFQDYAEQINSLSSQYELPHYDDLTQIPGTELYSQSLSDGYSSQTLTLYNPSDGSEEIDLDDYYLASERKDVQDVGVNSRPSSGLLGDLENLLFETMLRAGIGFTPILNDVADLYELFSGKDFITGETLSPLERSLSGLGLIAGSGSGYRYAKRMIHAPEKYAPRFVEGITKVAQKPLTSANVQEANRSLQQIHKRPHQSRPAEEVNSSHAAKGNSPPYRPKTRVVEFDSHEGEQWVRLHGPQNQAGHWIVRKEAVKGLSPEQLQKKYSLPRAPTEISDVTLPQSVKIRRGRVAENFGGNSGAVQYEILDTDLQKFWFANKRSLP